LLIAFNIGSKFFGDLDVEFC